MTFMQGSAKVINWKNLIIKNRTHIDIITLHQQHALAHDKSAQIFI